MLEIDALAEAAKIVMKPTSATPIMSADAVAAVRRGLRIAFSRASVPVMPRTLGSGAPMNRLIGRASTGPRTKMPMKIAIAPSPRMPSALSGRPNSAHSIKAPPPRVTARPIAVRGPKPLRRSIATSRIAAIGGTRDAFRAGTSAETTVTVVPTRKEATTAEIGITMWLAGMSKPIASSSALRPPASRMPRPKPIADATTPTTTASPRIESVTCRVAAPIARSSAISRVRCATTIENVL